MKDTRSLLSTLLAGFFAVGALLAVGAVSADTGNCGKDPKQMTEAEFYEIYRSEGGV